MVLWEIFIPNLLLSYDYWRANQHIGLQIQIVSSFSSLLLGTDDKLGNKVTTHISRCLKHVTRLTVI